MANQPLEPPLETRNHQINLDQVNAETQELRRLVDGLPPQIDQVEKGQLPNDLAENLKKIEKLAKHIRGEITP
jgi:prefoldin subunit 5